MAVVHVYKCEWCATEKEVAVKLGDDSAAPLCPVCPRDGGPKAEPPSPMKRSYKIGGAFIKW